MTNNNRSHATVLAIVCVLATACSKPVGDTNKNGSPAGREPITSTGVVKVIPDELTLGKGESGSATVRLQIQHGYHVNANPASFPYLIATQLDITPAAGVSVGAVTYPDPLTKKFSFSPDAPLKVYEGETIVKAMLKADAALGKAINVRSFDLGVAVTANRVAQIVGDDEQDIEFFGGERGQRRHNEKQKGKDGEKILDCGGKAQRRHRFS